MSLVQYGSSSEESGDESSRVRIVETKAQDSIASSLPAPKNRVIATAAKGRVLGAGSKNPLNIPQRLKNVELEKSGAKITSFIPHSVRGKVMKTGEITEKIAEKKPHIQLFQTIKSKPKAMSVAQSQIQVQLGPRIPDCHDEDTEEHQQQSSKRQLEEDNIKEFNVSDFYEENIKLKERGLLEENKRLHTVTHHKNQLSALVKNAKQDEELLNERFEQNKKARKERGDRYGW
jgi:hypothetical protein